jgi:hypothetical protein
MVPDELEGTCPNVQGSELFEGCSVHYVAYNGRCLTAIVIGHDDAKNADLAVFTNMPNAAGVKNFGIQFHQDVAFSKELKPGTWHWVA